MKKLYSANYAEMVASQLAEYIQRKEMMSNRVWVAILKIRLNHPSVYGFKKGN